MSIRNQREQLIHAATGQITMIVGVLICSWLYTVDHYTTLSAKVSETNIAIEKYNSTLKDGLSYNEVISLLQKNKGRDELLEIIQQAPKETQEVIKKVGSAPYLTWLEETINGSSVDKDKLMLKKARLNSILPTLSPISNNLIEDTIDMKKYISFIESNILKEFGIESNVSLGIQNIKYGKKGSEMPEEVGTFDTEISFTSTNDNISRIIDYINGLGHPELLMDTGATSLDGIPEVMSNPLVMIDTLSLANPLDSTKPNDENSGRMVIRFFIRGSSTADIAFLKETIKTRKDALNKKITGTLTKCINESTCSHKKELQALSRKYEEYNRIMTSAKKAQGIEGIYALSSELDSIQSLEKELGKITGKQ